MNFDFLRQYEELKTLYHYCKDAEDLVLIKPNLSAASTRGAMEYMVKTIYASVVGDYSGLNVFDMLSDYSFINYINDDMLMNTFHYIRKMGNIAVHEGKLSQLDSIKLIEQLHFLVGEYCILLGLIEDYPEFVRPGSTPAAPERKPEPEHAVVDNTSAPCLEKVEVDETIVAKFGPRMRHTSFDVKFGRDEEENKRLFMDACLREAGWPIVNKNDQALPSSAGINMLLDDGDSVDYVLYGKDNRPLAIIEYTETSKNLVAGRMKAIAVANKMEIKYGYKPIVYYTNGYYIYIIDQLGYDPRRVFQFHNLAELEKLKVRATIRTDISNPQINESIAGRDYQKKAIKAACKAFNDKRRHSLLVMATGTGKTRVSISIVDILMKAGWVESVLFLADRTSLVRQAHKNFNKQLPSVTTSMYTGGSMNKDSNARIIFSTYQTMINLINDDTREFNVGRFDLIVVDEAHRSIFKKYGALFNYFDSLMLGLTATPRSEDNKNTYDVFKLPNNKPDFAYELEEAVSEGYLVGFHVEDKTTDAMRRGIRYNDLSDDEKAAFEDAFADDESRAEDYTGTVIDAAQVRGTHVINLGTIDAMLNDLMKNGLKIEGGDKLGKTIIFSASHIEAEKIVERFNILYPYLGKDFCKLVDSHVAESQSLIDLFEERDKFPQICVSVDMLDTGIDVPDILNLVFFKSVKSKIKFLQMIGRGTRLSPSIYGPGLDKTGFLIFDYFDNFGYFSTRNTWTTFGSSSVGKTYNIVPQSILINKRRLGILRCLVEGGAITPFDQNYKQELKDYFIGKVQGLCNDDISVQYNMSYVSKYRTPEMWDGFTNEKIREIEENIIPLLPSEKDSVKAKVFDLMMYVIEDEVPKRAAADKDVRKIRHGFGNIGKKIDDMLAELTKLKTIPAIVEKEELIGKMRNADMIFDNFSYETCEYVRKELRDLMTYIPDNSPVIIINSSDFVIDSGVGVNAGFVQTKSYADRAKEYLNNTTPALAKIRNLDQLTDEEKAELNTVFKQTLGTETEYVNWSNNKALLPFLRIQVGIADEAIETKFGSFLNDNVLNDKQLSYMNQIINYAKQNGDITFMDLQTVSPFSDIDVTTLFGDKLGYIKTLVNGLHHPVM